MENYIFIGMPVLGNPWLSAINSLHTQVHGCGMKCQMYFMEQESLISRARNNIVHAFMANEKCTHLLFWDADIECVGTTHGENGIRKLVENGKDITGGLYALKAGVDGKLASQPLKHPVVLDGGIIQMRWLSTGMMMIARHVVEKMMAQYPELIYDGDSNMAGKKVFGMFNTYIHVLENGVHKYLSEDWAACARWTDMGGEIWADTSIVLNHWGVRPHKLWIAK